MFIHERYSIVNLTTRNVDHERHYRSYESLFYCPKWEIYTFVAFNKYLYLLEAICAVNSAEVELSLRIE